MQVKGEKKFKNLEEYWGKEVCDNFERELKERIEYLKKEEMLSENSRKPEG